MEEKKKEEGERDMTGCWEKRRERNKKKKRKGWKE